jgi:hypothetical protein
MAKMLHLKNIETLAIILISGALVWVISDAYNEKTYDVSNEITVLSRSNLNGNGNHDNQYVKVQPADYDASYQTVNQNRERSSLCPASRCTFINKKDEIKKMVVISQLNRNLISIRVIRNERTDFKNVILVTDIVLINNGGLPLGAFSNLEQFFDGTYFPPLFFSNPRNTKAPNGFLTVSAK